MRVRTSMYIVMCEITTEGRQITTSQRAKSGTTIRRKYITFPDDNSDSSQTANRVSQVNS
jgi:hypothetical protein